MLNDKIYQGNKKILTGIGTVSSEKFNYEMKVKKGYNGVKPYEINKDEFSSKITERNATTTEIMAQTKKHWRREGELKKRQ